jgi:hypothetical protein
LFRACAWCERFMGISPPVADAKVTHGICPDCSERLVREDRRTRGRVLLVVRQTRLDLRDRLEATFAGFPDVGVRIDQREGERRLPQTYEGADRRHHDRRRALQPSQVASWRALGVFVTQYLA